MTLIQVVLFVLLYAFVLSILTPSYVDTEVVEPKVKKCENASARTNERCLRSVLLKDYDTSVRPVLHHSNQTTVYMALFPMRIKMVQRKWMRLMCWVQKRWVDELLKWDPKDYDNLQVLTINPDSIWHPDIQPLPLKGSETGWTSSSTATVSPSGTVSYVATVSYYSYCDSDISKWPYDSYMCGVTLQSEAYKGSELNVFILDHKTPELKHYIPNPDWTLVSMSSARISSETFESKYFVVNLEYTFILKRNALILATTAVFPVLVFSLAQLAFFFLDKESSTRVMLCCVAMVTQCLFLTFANGNGIPGEGNKVPYIVTFYKYSFFLTGCILIWTIAARYMCTMISSPYLLHIATLKIHNNRFLSRFLPFEGHLGNASSLNTEDAAGLVTQAETENSQWRNMADFLDKIVFVFCLLVYLYLYILYIP